MKEKNRKPITNNRKKLPQFTTMNVIDGQAGLVNYSSLIFYSLTIDNILNIIVLLILAGISIAMLTGENGILSMANKAKTETENATKEEEIRLQETEESIDKWNVSAKMNLTKAVEIGDYVDYKEGIGNSYTSYKTVNGYNDQTFTSNNSIKWRVLTKENGKVYLISDDVVKADNNMELTLSGKNAYINGAEELNNICSIYSKGVGAEESRSVNVNDIINLICGDLSEYSHPIDIWDTSIYADGWDFFDEQGNETTKITRNYNYYEYLYEYFDTDTEYYSIIFLTNQEHEEDTTEYWLATQNFNGNLTGAWYGICETYYGGTGKKLGKYRINGRHLYKANGEVVERSSNIRPIVILNSDLKTSGKNKDGIWTID